MRQIRRSTQGFTIVELLIVIVVIAILAAITIVAFNGIQTRAENNKTISAVTQYVKALKLHYADKGEYPLDEPSVFKYKCVGDIGETCGMISGTYTTSCEGVSGITNNSSDADFTALNNAIKARINTIPQVSQQGITCDNRQVRGAIYFVYLGSVFVRYYLKGDQDCSAGGTKLSIAPETTRCQVTLPK